MLRTKLTRAVANSVPLVGIPRMSSPAPAGTLSADFVLRDAFKQLWAQLFARHVLQATTQVTRVPYRAQNAPRERMRLHRHQSTAQHAEISLLQKTRQSRTPMHASVDKDITATCQTSVFLVHLAWIV